MKFNKKCGDGKFEEKNALVHFRSMKSNFFAMNNLKRVFVDVTKNHISWNKQNKRNCTIFSQKKPLHQTESNNFIFQMKILPLQMMLMAKQNGLVSFEWLTQIKFHSN